MYPHDTKLVDSANALAIDSATITEVVGYYTSTFIASDGTPVSRRMAEVLITDGRLVLRDVAELDDLMVVPA